jgi:hypoxanthine phosphoribosyltransferase
LVLRVRGLSLKLEFIIPTWNEIDELLFGLTDKVQQDCYEPDAIVGVSRGGWPPARVMSDLLEIPEVANVKAEFYCGISETKGEPLITQPVSMPVKDKKLLVVDDVVDSGKSLRLVRTHLKEKDAADVKIAVIYYKPWSVISPDYYEIETEAWIIFPWEKNETVRNIVELYKRQGKSMGEAKKKLVSFGIEPKIIKRFFREISEGID